MGIQLEQVGRGDTVRERWGIQLEKDGDTERERWGILLEKLGRGDTCC